MRRNNILAIGLLVVFAASLTQCHSTTTSASSTPSQADKAALGKHLFFDANLSNPGGQSCATCHDSSTAFSDPNHAIVSPGVVHGLSGNRNAPSIAYSQFFPVLRWSPDDTSYLGGLFLDGRANTLEDQAKGPFLNHLEMNNSSRTMVVQKVQAASYFSSFVQVYGNVNDTMAFYNDIADALAAYERSSDFAKFTSKYDYYLKGQATLTQQEMHGLQLFQDSLHANCNNCHLITPDPASGKVLFTDMTYDNLGVPKNMNNPYYTMDPSENPEGASYIDRGIGSVVGDPEFDGFFKTPSLRNVAVTAPYFHNGFFKTLPEVVHWYNTRDSATAAGAFPPAEIPGNMDVQMIGRMHLSPQDEADIVAFLNTLTDGYK